MNCYAFGKRSAVLAGLLLAGALARSQFYLNGSAYQAGDSCWVLTTAKKSQAGSMWHQQKVDLKHSFQVFTKMRFGCKDKDGADGIVFVLQTSPQALGVEGGWLGFQGISPSLAVEFDTWENGILDDPPFDHVAILKNGSVYHQSPNNLAGPVAASATSSNIEDCNWHDLLVGWDASSKTLTVSFDCRFRLSYTGDVVAEIFQGESEVFWGFTASTGGATNQQEICLVQATAFGRMEDVTLCPGGQIQLDAGSGKSFRWSPALGLSNPYVADPIASPQATTVYVVEIADACGLFRHDTVTIIVDGMPLSLDLGADTTLCEGQSLMLDATLPPATDAVYSWSNGASSPTISATHAGVYAVTVTVDDYCSASDRIGVGFLPLPNPALPKDTVLCVGQILQLDATSPGGLSYHWQDGSAAPVYTVSSPGKYAVQVRNACGKGSAETQVVPDDCRQVYFPNAFSPNDDGINDLFLPFDNGDVASINYLRVFDRWGNLVFSAFHFLPNDFSHGWDGTVHGMKAPAMVYTWVVEITFRNGALRRMAGDVLLLR